MHHVILDIGTKWLTAREEMKKFSLPIQSNPISVRLCSKYSTLPINNEPLSSIYCCRNSHGIAWADGLHCFVINDTHYQVKQVPEIIVKTFTVLAVIAIVINVVGMHLPAYL